jgi:hypothetical protein
VTDARAVTAQAIVSTTLQPLSGLDNLVSLQYSPTQLHRPGVAILLSYQEGMLDACISNTHIPSIHPLSSLPALEALMIGTPSVFNAGTGPNSLSTLSSLTALTQLSLSSLGYVTSLDFLTAGFGSRLQCLELFNLYRISSLAALAHLTSLKTLFLGRFCGDDLDGGLAPLGAMGNSLTRLQLVSVLRLHHQGLQPITALSHVLEDLTIQGCEVWRPEAMQAVVSQLTGLTHLEVSGPRRRGVLYEQDSVCSALDFLGPLSHLVSLHMECSSAVKSLAPVGALTALQDLEIHCAANVSSLAPLSTLGALQRLKLQPVGPIVSSLEPLTALTGLQGLHLTGGPGVSTVASLQHLTGSLQNLHLAGFPRVPQPVLRALQLPALS